MKWLLHQWDIFSYYGKLIILLFVCLERLSTRFRFEIVIGSDARSSQTFGFDHFFASNGTQEEGTHKEVSKANKYHIFHELYHR